MNQHGRIQEALIIGASLLMLLGGASLCFGHETQTFTKTFLSSGTHTRTMFQDDLLTIQDYWSSETTPLSRRTDSGFALDQNTGDTLIFGGLNESNETVGDTWFRPNGGSWSEVFPSSAPSPRSGHTLVWVGSSSYLLFGGFDENGAALNDTWIYDSASSDWSLKATASSPSARGLYSLSYSPDHGIAVLFGGRDSDNFTADNFTWIYNVSAASWTKVSANPNPGLLGGAAMDYDRDEGKFIFFGGRGDSWNAVDLSSETWSFTPNTLSWTNLAPADPPKALVKSQLIYDQEINQCVLYGGQTGETAFEDRFFFFDFGKNRWKELIIPTTPASREGHKMVYDPVGGGGVFFGGRRNSFSNLLWRYHIYSSGTWVSDPIKIFGDTDIDWTGVSFQYDDPHYSSAPQAGSKVLLQFSSSQDGAAYSSFVGPGGSTSSFFTSTDSASLDLEDTHFGRSYIQVSAILASDDFPARPKIQDFTFSFNRAPTTPVLKTPANGNIVNTARPTLIWNLSGDNDGLVDQPLLYHVQADTHPAFPDPLINVEDLPKTSFDVQYQVTTDLISTTWYWRARAKDLHSLYGGWSSPFTLYVDTFTAPGPVTQLSAATGSQRGEISLTWTFPGDDDGRLDNGTALIRFSTAAAIPDETAWLAAADEREVLFSADPGETVGTVISGLTDATSFFFALKTRDEVGNLSDLSLNSPSAMTQSPPNAVTALSAAKGPGASDATLTWTFPGQNGGGITSGLVHVRASSAPINDETGWANAADNWSSALTAALGETVSTALTGLAASTSYYFAIKTEDAFGQVSAVSMESPLLHTNGPPLTVTHLTASRGAGNDELSLSWTFPGDYEGALSGGAALVRADPSGPILNESAWNAADVQAVFPLSAAPGSLQVHTLSGLGYAATYYFSVKVRDEFGALSALPASSPVDATNSSPTVTLISPADGAEIQDPHLLQWTSFDPDSSDPLSFALELSVTSGAGYEILFATNLPDGTSSFAWNTSFLPKGNKYRIRVTAMDDRGLSASDANAADLTRTPLAPAPIVAFTSAPASGQILGGKIPLVWTVTNISEYSLYSHTLYLSTDAGSTFSLIGTFTGNTTSWDSRLSTNTTGAQFKIVAQDSGSPPRSGSALSPVFTLYNSPPPTETALLYPVETHHPSPFDLTFSWKAPKGNIQAYFLDLSTAADLAGAARHNAGANTTYSLAEGALALDQTYYWRVVAVDVDNQETPSRTANFLLSRTRANTADEFLDAEAVSGFPADARIKFEDVEDTDPALVESGLINAKGDRLIKPFSLPVWRIKAVDQFGAPIDAGQAWFRIEFSYDQARARLAGEATLASPSLLKIARLDEISGRWRLVENQSETETAGTNFTALAQGPGIFGVVGVPEAAAPLAGLTNFPNPFSPDRENTLIRYVLTEDALVTVRIFNQLGDLAREMIFNPGEEGARGSAVGTTNEITWDGRNANGAIVSSGMYLVLIRTESSSGTTEKIRRVGVLR